ncbi:copper amine oxidase N-terminal domain-containing protein [Calidifontibacillus oryziterrae]|uniref:copper amine oxidase N-terminal domain-containing protein n=1 Tax=Calidifontibacillus oryziterrae TaxID=1191699 RepID=UPI00031DC51E|nr:copper amine oxidase N-terminal domain-containing protein [Calidifontibacillus oryziterrae]
MSKTLKVMTSAALLAGVVAPVAVDTVSANSTNLVDRVMYVDDDFVSDPGAATGHNNFIIKEDDVVFTTGETFRLSLPSGVKWSKGDYGVAVSSGELDVVSVSDRDLELEVNTVNVQYDIPLYFEIDGAEGEVKVTLDPRGSTFSSGQYTIAVVGAGSTAVSIDTVKTIGDNGVLDTIRLDETSIRSLYSDRYDTTSPNYDGVQEITLTLPSDFDWQLITTGPVAGRSGVVLAGGFVGNVADQGTVDGNGVIDPTGAAAGTQLGVSIDGNELTYTFVFTGVPSKLGTFYLENLAIDADKDADYGDIEVDLDGDEVSSGTIVIAKYADYGTAPKLEGDVPTLLAGRLTDDDVDVETVEVLIKESIAGSWLSNRSVDVEFPSWVKVLGVDVSDVKNIEMGGNQVGDSDLAAIVNEEIEGDSNEVNFDIPNLDASSSKKEFKVKFYVSTKADAEGDLTVKVSGRAGVEIPETTIAKVIAPVTVETEKVDVRTGIKKQQLNDIVITEAVKGALLEDKQVRIVLSDGVFTDEEPTITVEEGNVKIDQDSIDIDGNELTFDVSSESTRASKIVISGLSLDLSRSVPEGDVTIKVGGDAIVQNSSFEDGFAFARAENVADNALTNIKFGDKTYVDNYNQANPDQTEFNLTGEVDAGEFDQDFVTKQVIATVVTPAEGNATVNEVKFTIGSTMYTVDGQTVEMDVAAFVEAGRTFLPVRYVANALGVSDANILYDNATGTVTIIKGDRVAQTKLGSNVLTVNGANIPMDVAVKTVEGRTVLPLRYVAQALGADVQWDEATQTVTVK